MHESSAGVPYILIYLSYIFLLSFCVYLYGLSHGNRLFDLATARLAHLPRATTPISPSPPGGRFNQVSEASPITLRACNRAARTAAPGYRYRVSSCEVVFTSVGTKGRINAAKEWRWCRATTTSGVRTNRWGPARQVLGTRSRSGVTPPCPLY